MDRRASRIAQQAESAAVVPGAKPWRAVKGGIHLHIRLTPRSSRDAVGEIGESPDGPYIAVKVRALPSEGEANAALVRVVAKWLGLAQREVSLATGGKSRLKTLHLAGDPGDLAAVLLAKTGTST